MANWSDLKAAIAQVIKTNGTQAITGQILQDSLNNIVSNVGKDCTFVGIATSTTNPGVPDGNVFYLATEPGTYSNFNGIEIKDGEAAILEWRGSWVKKTTGFATAAKFAELSSTTNTKFTELEGKVGGVGYVTCDTAAGTAAKVVTVTGLTTLSTGIRLLVKMTNNNTASNATLNINSLGAKPLYYNNTRVSGDNAWEAGEIVDIYYDGTNFYAGNFQGGNSKGGNLILMWNTDAATTRKQVKQSDRKSLLQISYKNSDGDIINEQYIGSTFTDSEWSKDSNWEKIASELDLSIIKQDIIKNTGEFTNKDLSFDFTMNNDGKIAFYNNGTFKGIAIHVQKGDEFVISTIGGSNSRAWYIADASNNVLAEAEANLDTTSKLLKLVIEQDDAKLLYVNNNGSDIAISNFFVYLKQGLKNQIKESENKLTASIPTILDSLLKDTYVDVNITGFWYSNVIGDKLKYGDSTSFRRSEMIDCIEGDKFEITIKSGSGQSRAWAFADSDELIISTADSGKQYLNETIIAPVNARYVVFTESNISGVTQVIKKARISISTDSNTSKSTKILMVGNSFTLDAMCLVPYILKETLPTLDLIIGLVYKPGETLSGYDNIFANNGTIDSFYKYNNKKDTIWIKQGLNKINNILDDDDWDIIIFQQASSSANNYESYEPSLSNIINRLFTLQFDKSIKIGWLLTTPRTNSDDGSNYFNQQVGAIKKVLESTIIDVVIPCGTALQNCRTVEQFNSIGNEGYMMTDSHLQKGIAHMIESYTFVQWLLDYMRVLNGVYNNKWRPDDDTHWIIDLSKTVEGVTEENCRIAQISSIKAVSKPFEITDLNLYVE